MGQGDAMRPSPPSSAFVPLMAGAQAGDGHALGCLLQSFQPYLLSIARRELPDDLRGKCDPADLVQETLLEAHRGLKGFSGADVEAFRDWLRGILRHNLRDLFRRYRDASKRSVGRERSLAAGAGQGGPMVEEVDPDPTPCSTSISREAVAALRDALSRLPERERAVIALRYSDFLSFEAIGLRMECSSEAARKLCSRAMRRLQQMLEASHGPGN